MNITLLISNLIFSIILGQDHQDYRNVNSQQFKNMIESTNGSLLDVRTRSEFSNGHIKGAGQLNFYSLDFKKRLLLLSKNQPVYLYCNTGYRSAIAAEFLSQNGYSDVYNLAKGIMEWELLDIPVIIEPDARPDTEDKMEPDEFNALINGERLVLIDYYAPWCGPCRSMMPMIDKLKKEYASTLRIVKINSDASKRLIKQQQISSVPHFVLYKNGAIQYQYSGVIDEPTLRIELTKVVSDIK